MNPKRYHSNLIILNVCKSQLMTIGQLTPSMQLLHSCFTGDITTMGPSLL